MKKRLFSLFLVLILVFVSVEDVRADTGSLIIAGGSVAGVTAGAIAGPAVVAVFCAMMAFGMNVELTEASQEAGMTKTEFLKNKIQEYCNEAQISANTFNNYVLDQAEVLQNGSITISKKAGSLIERFCNWLFDSEQVINPSTSIPSTIVLNGVTCPVIMPGETAIVAGVNNSPGTVLYNSGSIPLAYLAIFCDGYNGSNNTGYYSIVVLSPVDSGEGFSITFQDAYANNNYTGLNLYNNGVYGRVLRNIIPAGLTSLSIPVFNAGNVGLDTFAGFKNYTDGITDFTFGNSVSNTDSIVGDGNDYDVSKGILNPSDNQTIVINPNINIPVPADKDITVDVNEYLEVIQDMIDGLKDDVITAIDGATGVPITIEFDPTQDWDPTIEKEDDTELPPDDEKTPVVDDDIIPSDFDPDPMKFDLKGIFPFCIPWDVKDMLSKLSADPVAPSYTVNWMIPIVNERLIFTVDLSPFDNVARVCRTMELFAFCVGLAIVTRQLFLRG